MATFTLSATLARPYDDAVDAVRAALGDQGFGILTEIDLKATLKAKLDVWTSHRRSSSVRADPPSPTRR